MKPDISSDAIVFENSSIIGDVRISKNVSVWYGAVLRADVNYVEIGENTNIQDNCVLHESAIYPLKIGKNVTIGHGAIVHACTVGDNVLIGMNAVVLDGAKIGKNSIVAAAAVVTQNKEFPDGHLILGAPAKPIRKLTDEEILSIEKSASSYVNLARESKK